MTKMRSAYLLLIVAVLILLFSRCFTSGTGSGNDPRGALYAGASACVGCHRPVFNSTIHSVHFKASSPVDGGALKALAVANPIVSFLDSSRVRVEVRGGSIFQSGERLDGGARAEKLELAFGAGRHAQTYGYWKEGQLYELPLSWFADARSWANSPGFPAAHPRFDRVIGSRCFECHASFVKRNFEPAGPLAVREVLDRSSIVYGIDCERCHGPGLEHVRFQRDNPGVRTAKYITRIGSLSRQQQLDLCGMCHSGNDREAQRSLFDFVPGDTLNHFYFPSFGAGASAEPDVHGQQLQGLRRSKCFAGSDLTCGTCHSGHGSGELAARGGAGDLAVRGGPSVVAAAVTQCVRCHGNSAHVTAVLKETEQRKRDFNLTSSTCVDCHMPLTASKVIVLNGGAGAKPIPYLLRTHNIAIYK